MQVKEKIQKLLESLNKGVYEREEAIKLSLLSSIAGESTFLLGPPGVAKSLVARKLKFAFKDASVFEYLMSRFSTPDEIFGPVSIKGLKDNDKYERVVKKYLPSSDVVFLDEIWKAGPSIQNSLLTVINEKVYRNGDQEIKVPMKALISASNELPEKDKGLEALWDRFLVRLYVGGIEDKDNFNKMITEDVNVYEDTVVDAALKISNDDYAKWDKAINKITVPENVLNVIAAIRNYINKYNEDVHKANEGKDEKDKIKTVYVSDRRWRKVVRLLRTSAFLNGRSEVDLMDCFLIVYCIWEEEEQMNAVSGFVKDAIEKYGYRLLLNFETVMEALKVFKEEIKEETIFVKDTRKKVLKLVHGGYYEIVGDYRQNIYNSTKDILLIKQTDFNLLVGVVGNINVNKYYYNNSYKRIESYSSFSMRKGTSPYSVIINDTEYELATQIQGDKRQLTKKPHPSVEKDWDEKVNQFLQYVDKMRNQLDKYREKDLKHLRTNLFVNPVLANVVETHITATQKEIEKIQLDVLKTQSVYKKLKGEEVVVNNDSNGVAITAQAVHDAS